jgi:hypothetical protein
MYGSLDDTIIMDLREIEANDMDSSGSEEDTVTVGFRIRDQMAISFQAC